MSLLSLLVVFSRVRVVLREETRNKTRRFFDAELCVCTVFLRTPRERREEKKKAGESKKTQKSILFWIFFFSSSSSSKKKNHFLLSLLFLNVTRNRYKFETTVSLHFTLSRGCFFTHQLLTALPFFENAKEKKKRKKKRKKLPSSLSHTRWIKNALRTSCFETSALPFLNTSEEKGDASNSTVFFYTQHVHKERFALKTKKKITSGAKQRVRD